jgi:hypothetical protein
MSEWKCRTHEHGEPGLTERRAAFLPTRDSISRLFNCQQGLKKTSGAHAPNHGTNAHAFALLRPDTRVHQ